MADASLGARLKPVVVSRRWGLDESTTLEASAGRETSDEALSGCSDGVDDRGGDVGSDAFEKGHIEKMLGSVATTFAQFLPGYTGRNTDHRGRHPEEENLWALPELQDLLDEWIVAHFTDRRSS
jgi:hypothetical protein